ncbi:TrbC/VirB2 family protein [Pandoraea oxalativorans]|uniref:Type VI secretion protein n=1 Tax=Pandoraea oxalativorans TaxID=573737 RepID=A0A0G3IIS2_9BURK|nr:TrbC/VirB2 family protein [Pandoraea oxalativorans]AKK24995.1 type VI secretion protein [Pandoraea oxalativorans]
MTAKGLEGGNTPATDKMDRVLNCTAHVLMFALVFLPQFANAQSAGGGAFDGITQFLKSITQLLIYEWGYYIGIITLAIQGYRWKTGRIDMMALGGWGLGIGLVFFAPNIVSDLKSRAGGSV